MTLILKGEPIAQQIKSELKEKIHNLKAKPKLAVVLVGNNPSSEVYVRKKREACREVGIESELHLFNPDQEADAIQCVQTLNQDKSVNGILVQLPLPKHWNSSVIFDTINVFKDVDCFHPENMGLLVQNRPRFLPPTPHAVQQLLVRYGITFFKKNVTIINRSTVVGKPLSSILIQDNGEMANATVTVCHDHTPEEQLTQQCLASDILVVAVGIPGFLGLDKVTPKHVVVDVGITRLGKKIVGDVHSAVFDRVGAISPVPGGVGVLTVAMLLHNTVKAWEIQNS